MAGMGPVRLPGVRSCPKSPASAGAACLGIPCHALVAVVDEHQVGRGRELTKYRCTRGHPGGERHRVSTLKSTEHRFEGLPGLGGFVATVDPVAAENVSRGGNDWCV